MVLIGINIGASYRFTWFMIQKLKQSGMKLIVIDPRVTEAAAIADVHLQAQPGTDAALLLGMMNVIIKGGLYDKEFVDNYCYGFDKLAERIEEYPPERVCQITGVATEKIIEASRMYATHKPGIFCHGSGLEHIPNPSQALMGRFLLPAITGNLDVPGGHYLTEPHPAVGLAADVECEEALSPEQKAKLIGSKEFPLFSSWEVFHKIEKNMMKVRERPFAGSVWLAGMAHTPSLLRAILTGKPYPIKAMVTESVNPLLSLPNSRLVYEAMKNLDFQINMEVFMTPSALLADYVLPSACYLERPIMTFGDYVNTFAVGEAAIPPMYERKTEYYLWRELGLRLGQEEYWPWKTLEEAYEYRLQPMGLTFKQAAEQQVHSSPMHFKKYEKVGFGTPTGKVELYNTTLEELGFDPLPSWQEWSRGPTSELAREYPMVLISGRVKVYMHSQYRQIASVRKRYPHPIAQLKPEKAQELGIMDGDWIWIETQIGRAKFKCQYSEGILANVVSAEFAWWFPEDPAEEPSLHGLWKSNLNALMDDDPEICDPLTGTWPLRAVQCKVYKASDWESEDQDGSKIFLH